MTHDDYKRLLFAVYTDLENDIRSAPWFEEEVECCSQLYPDRDFEDDSNIDLFVEIKGDNDCFDEFIRGVHGFIKQNHINSMTDERVQVLLGILSKDKKLDIASDFANSNDKRDIVTYQLLSRVCYLIYKDLSF